MITETIILEASPSDLVQLTLTPYNIHHERSKGRINYLVLMSVII